MTRRVSRRRFLRGAAAASLAGLLAAHGVDPRRALAGLGEEDGGVPATVPPTLQTAGRARAARTLYRDAAFADGRSDRLRRGISLLVEEGRITWIRPRDDEGPLRPRSGVEIVDARGATIVPGMVDAHSHLTLPGGASWIERIGDPPARLLRVAEQNGDLAMAAGVRWFRDVGSPTVRDPEDGRRRALALGVRDRWAGRPDRPKVRAAGTWLAAAGVLPRGTAIEVRDARALLDAARRQLDQGADLVKLYVESRSPGESPWSADEIGRVVDMVHRRGATVTAHVQRAGPARTAVAGRVDALEHGFRLEPDIVRRMARQGTFLVSTLTVPRSFIAIGRAAAGTPFSSRAGRSSARALLRDAEASVALAHRAGVPIAAGTDFGGGSSRANQLAWEVTSLVRAGLEPFEALAAATWRGGQLLREPEAGTIREGGPADLFLVHGDPLSDPEALWRVWRIA